MPASKPSDIRNIVLLGHGGAGKTTLGEAMLFATKVTTRLGSVLDKTSILDSSDLEKERQHSIDPSLGSKGVGVQSVGAVPARAAAGTITGRMPLGRAKRADPEWS